MIIRFSDPPLTLLTASLGVIMSHKPSQAQITNCKARARVRAGVRACVCALSVRAQCVRVCACKCVCA